MHSVSEAFYLPAVLRTRWSSWSASTKAGRLSLSRNNILLRDKFQ